MLKLILKCGDNHSSHTKKTSSSQTVEIKDHQKKQKSQPGCRSENMDGFSTTWTSKSAQNFEPIPTVFLGWN